MLKIRPLAFYVVAVFAVLSALMAAASWYMHPYPTATWFFYAFVYSIGAYISWQIAITAPDAPSERNWSWKESAVLAVLFIICTVQVVIDIPTHPTWIDEYTHAMIAAQDPVQGAAGHHQPPLSYFFSWSLAQVFGLKMLTIRLASVLPFIGSFLILGVVGLQLRGGIPFLILLGALFITNSSLHYVSLEGSPFSISLLGWSAWLMMAVQQYRQPTRSSMVLLACMSFFFLNTAGLAPALMLVLLAVIQGITGFVLKEDRWKQGALGILIGLFFFLPFQIFLWNMARAAGTVYFQPSLFWSLPGDLGLKLSYFWVPNYSKLMAVAFVFALHTLFRNFLTSKEERNAWLVAIAFVVLFPLLYLATLQMLPQWPMHPWSSVCFVAFLLWATSLAIGRGPQKWAWSFIGVILVLLVTVSPRLKFYQFMTEARSDWQSLTTHLETTYADGNYRSYVVGPCDSTTSWWCEHMFVGAELMFPQEKLDRVPGHISNRKLLTTPVLSDNGMVSEFLTPPAGERIITVIIPHQVHSPSWPVTPNLVLPLESNGFRMRKFERFTIIESLKPLEARSGIESILTWMTAHLPARAEGHYMYELLIRNHALAGDLKGAQQWMSKMQALSGFKESSLHPKAKAKVDSLELIMAGIKK